ncbi:hypothetical protein AAF712_010159 [Marasmius tenuissimus]|uniref:Uncharacterized protein n=1 Tax=Marasmius tenuissimus TaxID=585030 RepID=A0ABR2ZNK8_9AGAR
MATSQHHADETILEDEGEYSQLPLLNPGTIQKYYPDADSVKPQLTLLPTLQPFYRYGGNEKLRNRRKEAFAIAANLEDHKIAYEKLKQAARYVLKIFSQQSSDLTVLLSNILQGQKTDPADSNSESKKISVFSLDPRLYKAFIFSLFKTLSSARDSFQVAGRKPPEVPSWMNMGGERSSRVFGWD